MAEMIKSEQPEKDLLMPTGIRQRQIRTNLIQIKSCNICFAMELDTAITCTANNEVINKHISIAVYHLVEFIQGWNGIVFWPNEKDRFLDWSHQQFSFNAFFLTQNAMQTYKHNNNYYYSIATLWILTKTKQNFAVPHSLPKI